MTLVYTTTVRRSGTAIRYYVQRNVSLCVSLVRDRLQDSHDPQHTYQPRNRNVDRRGTRADLGQGRHEAWSEPKPAGSSGRYRIGIRGDVQSCPAGHSSRAGIMRGIEHAYSLVTSNRHSGHRPAQQQGCLAPSGNGQCDGPTLDASRYTATSWNIPAALLARGS